MKKKKIIIAVVVIILLLATAGIVVWRVFFPDVFKSKEDSFWDKAESAVGLNTSKFSDYSSFLNDYKKLSDKSLKAELNVSANLQLDNLDSDAQDVINNSTIKIETYSDNDEGRTQEKIGLYAKKSEVLTLDLVTNGDTFGLKCADLSDKYYTVTLDDLITYLSKNSSIPSSTRAQISSLKTALSNVKQVDPYKLLYISEDDLKHFDDTYGDIFKKLIPKNCYSSKKDVEVEIDGEKVKTTGYYLTITGEDAYNFVKDLLDVVKKDDVLSKIITEKGNLIAESMDMRINELNEDDVSDYMEKALDELLSSMDEIKDNKSEAIQIAIYSNKSNSRIEFNVLDDVEDMDDAQTILIIQNKFEKNSDKEKKGKLSISVPEQKETIDLDYEIVNKDDLSKFALTIGVPDQDTSISIAITSEGNIDKGPVDISGSFKMAQEDQSMELKFDGSIEADDDISIPKLTSNNSVDVLKLSAEKQKEELNNILKKASEVLPSRLKLLGIDVKAEDIYKAPAAPTTTTPDTPATTPATPTTPDATTNSLPNNEEIQKTITEIQKNVQQDVQNNTVNTEELQKNIQKTQDLINSLQR